MINKTKNWGTKESLRKFGTGNFATRKFGTREYSPSVFSIKNVFSALLFSLPETIPELMLQTQNCIKSGTRPKTKCSRWGRREAKKMSGQGICPPPLLLRYSAGGPTLPSRKSFLGLTSILNMVKISKRCN